tara:strand:- start:590 stop:1171 length:582 start_codon:yes stop_codon:yes gene_type:complete
MIEPFEVYKLYLALKLHFTKKDYDITKTKGAVKVKQETFLKRKDLTVIRKLARDYSRSEIIDFLVANFVSGEKWGGLFDVEANRVYKQWSIRKSKREYTFVQDVDALLLEMEKNNISNPFFEKSSKHPLTFRLYFAKMITIETLVILDKIFNFVDSETDDVFISDISLIVKKYRPFVRVTDKMKSVAESLNVV